MFLAKGYMVNACAHLASVLKRFRLVFVQVGACEDN